MDSSSLGSGCIICVKKLFVPGKICTPMLMDNRGNTILDTGISGIKRTNHCCSIKQPTEQTQILCRGEQTIPAAAATSRKKGSLATICTSDLSYSINTHKQMIAHNAYLIICHHERGWDCYYVVCL